MAKDRSTPALLELITQGGASAVPVSKPVSLGPSVSNTSDRVEKQVSSVDAGSHQRIVRLPIGYVYVGSVAAVVLVIAAYFVGAAQGRSQAGATTDSAGLSNSGLNESVRRETPSNNAVNENRSNQNEESAPPINPNRTSGAPGGSPRSLDVDTRQSGLNYIIIERFPAEEAWSVREFLARNGIDVLILPDNNPSLLQVVTRQGFSGWASNDQAQAMDRRLGQLGRQWKDRESGSKDFSRRLARKQP